MYFVALALPPSSLEPDNSVTVCEFLDNSQTVTELSVAIVLASKHLGTTRPKLGPLIRRYQGGRVFPGVTAPDNDMILKKTI